MNKRKRIFRMLKWAALLAALISFLTPATMKRVNEQADIKEIETFISVAPQPEEKEAAIERILNYNALIREAGFASRDPFVEQPETMTEEDRSLLALVRELSDSPHLVAALIIPSIDLKIPVYYGTSEAVLSKGAGILEGTFFPTGAIGEHTVLAGHRGTQYRRTFHGMGGVKPGDVFYVINSEAMLVYQVQEIRIFDPSETGNIQLNDNSNQVSLLTCDPIPSYHNRMLVIGELQAAKPLPPDTTLEQLLLPSE